VTTALSTLLRLLSPRRSLASRMVARSNLMGAIALVALCLAGFCLGQQLDMATCLQKGQEMDQNSLLMTLAPCQSGASAACCEAGQNLAGLMSSAPLAGCLCYQVPR
jgi:hypothetical protein